MECVRGLAALWVFLFHIPDLVRMSMPGLSAFAAEGHRGVPVFFVVSGYCIFAAAERCLRQQASAGSFLRRRLRRIFPTFWISILLVLALPYALEALAALKSGSMQWPAPRWLAYSASDWLAIASLTKDLVDVPFGDQRGYTLVNSVYWTLGIELQFYLVMYAAISSGRHWRTCLALVSLFSFLAVGLAWFAVPGFFLSYWPAFLCGVLLRIAYAQGFSPLALCAGLARPRLAAGLLAAGATLAIVAALVAYGSRLGFLGTAVAAALILWCLGGLEQGSKVPHARRTPAARLLAIAAFPFLLLGECSYSVYLLHGKVYQLPAMLVRQGLPLTSPWHLPCVIVGTLALCYGFYLVVERRYMSQPSSATAERPALAVQA
jgi:peptidoglycan/LPS O-acetylase OafA/YrhL